MPAGQGSGGGQGSGVGVGLVEADREADEAVGDAEARALLGREVGVDHGRRVGVDLADPLALG